MRRPQRFPEPGYNNPVRVMIYLYEMAARLDARDAARIEALPDTSSHDRQVDAIEAKAVRRGKLLEEVEAMMREAQEVPE